MGWVNHGPAEWVGSGRGVVVVTPGRGRTAVGDGLRGPPAAGEGFRGPPGDGRPGSVRSPNRAGSRRSTPAPISLTYAGGLEQKCQLWPGPIPGEHFGAMPVLPSVASCCVAAAGCALAPARLGRTGGRLRAGAAAADRATTGSRERDGTSERDGTNETDGRPRWTAVRDESRTGRDCEAGRNRRYESTGGGDWSTVRAD